MSYGVKLRVWGDFACFTRPEMKVERVSYDMMTPSAARGILEAIYWKPEIRWIVDRIHILNPIRFTNIRRNEVSDKISVNTVSSTMQRSTGNLALFVEDKRVQRAALVLHDVNYVIEAHFEIIAGAQNDGKHLDQFNRRARNGSCFHRPYLGCREFPVSFSLIDGEIPQSPLRGEQDLGWMLHDLDYPDDREAQFFHAILCNGILDCHPKEVRG